MTQTLDIPKSSAQEFHAKQRPYALVVGVFNEGDKFTRQLEALQPYRAHVDIIIADGGSNDGATAAQAIQDKMRTLLINTDEQRGLSVQYRSALHYALQQGYEGVVMMDGNGKDGVEAIPRFIEKLKEGYDFVQGSRFTDGGFHKNTPLIRVLGIQLVFNPIVMLATGYAYTDAMNGFKACSRAMLLHPKVQPFRNVFVRYGLQYFFNYCAPKLDLRLCEIPVSRVYIIDTVPHSKIVGYRAYFRILGELLKTVTGGFNPRA
jgi:glycosyltransferase involved in cell wall biosynthesis